MLEYHIPLQTDDALNSLNGNLKIEGESCTYEVLRMFYEIGTFLDVKKNKKDIVVQ